jgi:FhuF-like iron-sulfur protein
VGHPAASTTSPGPTTERPITATFRRLARSGIAAPSGPSPGERFVGAAELARDRDQLAIALARIGSEFGTDRADICAARLIELWVWHVASPAAGALLVASRLPEVAPENTLLSLTGGTAEWAAAFASGRFYCLDVDPCSAHPDAAVVADEAELLARLNASLTAQLDPLVESLNELARRPRRALWRGATDRLVGAFLWAGDAVGAAERGRLLAQRAVAIAPPLQGRARTQLVQLAGCDAELVQVRDGCCLYYRVPGGERCSSCPLVCDSQRGVRLAAERF